MKDYAEAQAWMNERAKGYRSKGAFYASEEYAAACPEIHRLFDEMRTAECNVILAEMTKDGLKVGDRVTWGVAGWAFTSTTYSGKIVMRNGLPTVRHDCKIDTTTGVRRFTHWHHGWRKDS